jgi:hypothetical protein
LSRGGRNRLCRAPHELSAGENNIGITKNPVYNQKF